MTTKKFIFTSESVGYGHPDKLCDKISDTILDAHLKIDPDSKVAIETMISPNLIVIAGEVNSRCSKIKNEVENCYDENREVKNRDDENCDYENREVKNRDDENCDDENCDDENCDDENRDGENDNEINLNKISLNDKKHILSKMAVDYEKIARSVLRDCGYTAQNGIDPDTCTVIVNVNQQSDDINRAVSLGGAGDQGMMFGYATNETEEKIPMSLLLAHRLVMEIEKLNRLRKNLKDDFNNELKNKSNYIPLGPDCKSQVSVEYLNNSGEMVPLRVDAIVMSVQHDSSVGVDQVRKELKAIVDKVVPKNLLINTKFYLQPTIFTIGGPAADTGLTGRKIIVDTYGGFGCHGGGAFSGKDATKVDRSGAYMARYIAKSLVESNICKRVLVQLSYAIGIDHPISINVDTYNTSKYDHDQIIEIIKKNFDLSPIGIINELKLKMPIYSKTAVYGHFGRNEFSWENPKKLKLN
ncbi:S-adenosylmethionine synthase isoform type-2 [Dictyocoela muelleri]|nr:S-adenosylmethionine synthase isoform type-2 [Dictyocoela muelleri]